MSEKKKYDSTVARIAGNLLSGVMAAHPEWGGVPPDYVAAAVTSARAIVEEVQRTEQEPKP